MTAFAAITLFDGAATPVEHTFSPAGIDQNGVARLYENSDTAPLDARQAISLGVKLPKAGSPVARVTAKVVMPVMDEVEPTKKIGELIANVEFVLPKTVSLAQRKDLLAYTSNFLAEASVIAAVQSLESIY
jgi:hypothetical protein